MYKLLTLKPMRKKMADYLLVYACEKCKEKPISCFSCHVEKAVEAGDVIEVPEPVAEFLVFGRLATPEPGVSIDTSRFIGLRDLYGPA
jgi:hypothetical protein